MQTTSATITKKRTSQTLFNCLVALILSGCANTNNSVQQACSVSDSLVQRNGTPGVQFINECQRCVAVAFEYRNPGEKNKWTACYVPAQSRVVFWEADEYWLITRKPCDIAKAQGLGGISTTVLEANEQTGRCDTLGAIANVTILPREPLIKSQ